MIAANHLEKVDDEAGVFQQISGTGHEQVVFCNDPATGLKAIIGIHNTVLGSALGGTRMWDYATEQEALTDVLRLSRGMTFKAAISGLNLGGGKAVIIGNTATIKNEALLRRFGKFVESLNGRYVTAEDVNMSPEDMEYIAMETRHVTGLSENIGGGGDPSPVTAYGVYMGMKAAAHKAFGSDSLENKKVAVQGVGHVGMCLVEYLAKENAKIYVTDISENRIKEAVSGFKAIPVEANEIYDLDTDIFSPCALGATVNDDTIDRLKCKVIAGAANNQLQDEGPPWQRIDAARFHLCPGLPHQCWRNHQCRYRLPWWMEQRTGVQKNGEDLPDHPGYFEQIRTGRHACAKGRIDACLEKD